MMEGSDLTRWFTAPPQDAPRLLGRMTSFVTMRSGHFEHGPYFQGISYFLPNMSWIQPPGYVHQMITQTWAENVVPSSLSNGAPNTLTASAQVSADNSRLVIQLTNALNNTADTQDVTVNLVGGGWTPSGPVRVWTLSEPVPAGTVPSDVAGNWPGNPTYISPVLSNTTWPSGSVNFTITLLPLSFTVLEVEGGASVA
jgi:hypothetical protein